MNSGAVTVIIVAGGSGSRFGASMPKQYCDYGGRPLLMTTIDRVRVALPEADIRLVIARDWRDEWAAMCRAAGFQSPKTVIGGATRWESVKNAVDSLEDDYTGVIMVHDAARPLLSGDVARRLLESVRAGASGAVPVIAMDDSMRELSTDGLSAAVDRSRYVRVQTPQAFDAGKLRQAYSLPYRAEMTDDASVMEFAGFGAPELVKGDVSLMKVTRRDDLDILRHYDRES